MVFYRDKTADGEVLLRDIEKVKAVVEFLYFGDFLIFEISLFWRFFFDFGDFLISEISLFSSDFWLSLSDELSH